MISELGHHSGISRIANVTLIGHDDEIHWGQDAEEMGHLRVVLPETKPCDHAWVLHVGF